jgi:TrkA-N domain/RyR domain
VALPRETGLGEVASSRRALRHLWRGRFLPAWREVRGVVLVGLGLFVLVLGTIGFEQLHSANYGLLDSLYRATTLFAFGGAVVPPVPTALQVARIVAPILTGYAAVGAIFLLGREQAQIIGIRLFARGHIIIAGFGAMGSCLARALDDRDVRVVVIDSDATNARLAGAHARGIRVLVGDATDHALLRKAGVRHARHLVAVCGSGGVNVDVAAAVRSTPRARRGVLTVFAHLGDIDLWRSLAEDAATFGAHSPSLHLEYFNVYATGAQLLLERHPPFPPAPGDGEPRTPHILLVGLDSLGEQLVLRIARLWHSQFPGPDERLAITLAGASAGEDLGRLLDRYPPLERYCSLGTRPGPIESAAFQSGSAMLDEDGACDVTHAYVCLEDEADALEAAVALHAAPDALSVPVAVVVDDSRAGVATVLAAEGGRFANISAFGLLTEVTSPELLLRGMNEVIARAKHEEYIRDELANGGSVEENPSMRPWGELEESMREDNRKFADGIGEKLTATGCVLVPMALRDPDEPPFSFTDAEVESLARQEHERWFQAKLADGWRFGRPRDDERKLHDQLVPWEELDERNRDRDRDPVRQLPEMLELTGFRIQRCSSPQPVRTASRGREQVAL